MESHVALFCRTGQTEAHGTEIAEVTTVQRARIAICAMSYLCIAGLCFASSASAVQDDEGAPPPKKEERLEDRLVPIPSWSKDVADNGCPLHSAPSPHSVEALTSLTELPFWELVQYAAGPYSVRAIVDTPQEFRKVLEPLDSELRTLALLHYLWNGLGRDGLHTYFFLKSGHSAPLARDALQAAGLAREHALFSEALALFGAPYPEDDEQREKLFGYSTPSKELNDFDRRLLALSDKFGSREDWTGIIVAYVNRTPALWRRIEAVRRTLGDMPRLEYLTNALVSRVNLWQPFEEVRKGIDTLTKPQRTLYILAAFNYEFENGGVHQFFLNSEGSLAPDVAEAMAEIGLDRQAGLIRCGIAMFKQPYPRDTQLRRETHFHEGWSEWDEQLSGLTDEFYALDGGPQVLHIGGDMQIQGGPGLRYAMLAFAKHHNMLPC